jgi:hypothetical protein
MAETSHGRLSTDYLARDFDSILGAMRALIPQKLPEWTDHDSEADFGNVLLELFAHMGDVLSYYQDRVANESFLTTATSRRSVIEHLRLIGYRLSTAGPASAQLSVSVPAAAATPVTITRGDAFATRSEKDRPSVRFEYSADTALTVDLATLPVDATTGRKVFGFAVEEGRLVAGELVAISDGSPNQRHRLPHAPLILGSKSAVGPADRDLEVLTLLGGVTTPWTRQDTLAFSRAGQHDYVVEIDDEDVAAVVFGDGAFGACPELGAEIRATYRIGGGAAGNVPANAIATIVGAPQLALLGARVTNPAPATGGSDRETAERAILHAPSVFRSMRRAVSAGDYEALALDFPGVGKVRARATNWNTVTLYVAPAGGGAVSDLLRANLLAYFEDKRPISTRIEIAPVDYVPILVTAEIGVLPYYAREDTEAVVRAAAGALLAFENVDFAMSVFLSRFYEVIEAIDAVSFANVSEFRRADRLPDPDQPSILVDRSGKLVLGENEIPVAPADPAYAGGIRVVVVEGGF